MKEIMAKHSSEEHQGVASFGYCPASTIHPVLFELNRPLDDLEGMLLNEFAGQTLTTVEIYDRHNVGRPYTMKNYKTNPRLIGLLRTRRERQILLCKLSCARRGCVNGANERRIWRELPC